jgi:opacity protein-like surface antigen
MIHKKTKLVLGIATASLTLAAAMVSPEALANKSSKKHIHDIHYLGTKHKHKKAKKVRAVEAAPVVVAPVAAAPAAYDDSALKQRIAELENRPAPVAKERAKDNMVFFRGGWAHAFRERNGVSTNSTALNAFGPGAGNVPWNQGRADKDAWYFGAGLDFSVDDNLFGLMNNTEVLAEVMFEYKEFADKVAGNVLAQAPTTPLQPRDVTVSQFTVSASPKIKFMKGSSFRPWIIPVGFSMNIVSPPSESITVLQPGMMFGVGADYNLWKNVYVGADARYQQNIGRTLDGVPTNGYTVGGYLGLGF